MSRAAGLRFVKLVKLSRDLVYKTILGPFFSIMDISFKSVAFQLQYTSAQIDAVYALLGLVDNGNYRIPSATLKMYKGDLPEKFKEWLEQCDENINICFEHHKMPDTNLSSFNDWDLIEYD